MKALGIDTTTRFLSLGLCDNHKVYAYNLEVGTKLSTLLSVTIKRALDALGWRASDIDYFACGLGPGSFTGVRIGLATIKGMSLALGRPVIGISTLDILAKNAPESDAEIIPAIDAKRDLIYTSAYRNKKGKITRIRPYQLSTVEDFLKKIKADAIILGDAAGLYRDRILTRIEGARILDKDAWYPQAHHIMELVLEKIKKKEFSSPFKIKPIYLYPKECQIRSVTRN